LVNEELIATLSLLQVQGTDTRTIVTGEKRQCQKTYALPKVNGFPWDFVAIAIASA